MSKEPVAEAATYTTQSKHKGGVSIASASFEPTVPAVERPQT